MLLVAAKTDARGPSEILSSARVGGGGEILATTTRGNLAAHLVELPGKKLEGYEKLAT